MVRRHLPSLERLRALREVARLGGFSAAADTLGLTQPAVSNQIRQLEQQLVSARSPHGEQSVLGLRGLGHEWIEPRERGFVEGLA